MQFSATELYKAGLLDLIPVIPPSATLAPTSKIPQSSLGKIPGRRNANGTWAGFAWQNHVTIAADVAKWTTDGANIGLRAKHHPGLDIDIADEALAQVVEDFALARLGDAPIRIGRAPKRLLMYHTVSPFSRMRLWIKRGDESFLVEMLGRGNQYLVSGIHPKTLKPYDWNVAPTYDALVSITKESTLAFFTELAEMLAMIYDVKCELEGDGRTVERASAGSQSSLLAPDLATLQEVVDLIPNNTYDYERYVKMGYAIRAAAGEDVDGGFNVFASWGERWTEKPYDADATRDDWRRFKPPFAVGFPWLAECARPFGYNDAEDEFEAVAVAPDDVAEPAPVLRSDQWLADEILKARAGELRFAPAASKWYVWNAAKWSPDDVTLAEAAIDKEMVRIADRIMREWATDAQKKAARADAKEICSGGKASTVRLILARRPEIAISTAAFDSDPWILNTPGGMVDLKLGTIVPADPDALCSKATSVAPDFDATPTRWLEFLHEACGEDEALVDYIQRWCGYSLTGSTREQAFAYFIGDGGNGKGVVFRALAGVLNDYAKTATLDTFTAAAGDRHSTDIAALEGARLVTSAEAQPSKAWDTQRIKSMTGGDAISARLMRQDNRTFQPLFKVMFAGNSLPSLPNVDKAMKRRLQVVPFTVTPRVVDGELDLKIRAEYPALLAWMIAGCLEWQRIGLAPPESVLKLTAHYFKDQDVVGRFIEEQTTLGGATSAGDVYRRFQEWCNGGGEPRCSAKAFGSRMSQHGIERGRTRTGSTYALTLSAQDFDAL